MIQSSMEQLALVVTQWFQVTLAGTLTGVQGDIRCKVLAAISALK